LDEDLTVDANFTVQPSHQFTDFFNQSLTIDLHL
jgi:hypothetical protein